jgi:major membrane immunogen (membrane-anchored lipoprotein)
MPEDMAVRIAQAVEKADRPLRDEIASREEKTAALEATQATLSDNQFIQLKLTNDLKEAAQKASQSAIMSAMHPTMFSQKIKLK